MYYLWLLSSQLQFVLSLCVWGDGAVRRGGLERVRLIGTFCYRRKVKLGGTSAYLPWPAVCKVISICHGAIRLLKSLMRMSRVSTTVKLPLIKGARIQNKIKKIQKKLERCFYISGFTTLMIKDYVFAFEACLLRSFLLIGTTSVC